MKGPLFILLVTTICQIPSASTDVCHAKHFQHVSGVEQDDYLIYGLTQDCTIFFIRPSQLPLLSTMKVNTYNSYCYPNLVQLHVQSQTSLLLLIRQAGSRICTLVVQIPASETIFGDHLFSYSLLSSLPYATCSHSSVNSLSLEPDLSFMDTVYKDVINFVDGQSMGLVWAVHQFVLTDQGYLKHLEKLAFSNHGKSNWSGPDLANDYVLALDVQRNYLYKRNRLETEFIYECAYDLLFRTKSVRTYYANTSKGRRNIWLNSMAVDDNVMIYTETDRTVQPRITRLFGMNVSLNKESHCIFKTNYAFDVGLIRKSTLMKLKENLLPKFDSKKRIEELFKTTEQQITTVIPEISSTDIRSPQETTLDENTILFPSTDVIGTSTIIEEEQNNYFHTTLKTLDHLKERYIETDDSADTEIASSSSTSFPTHVSQNMSLNATNGSDQIFKCAYLLLYLLLFMSL